METVLLSVTEILPATVLVNLVLQLSDGVDQLGVACIGKQQWSENLREANLGSKSTCTNLSTNYYTCTAICFLWQFPEQYGYKNLTETTANK